MVAGSSKEEIDIVRDNEEPEDQSMELQADNHIGQYDSESYITENDEDQQETECGDDDGLRVYDAANADEDPQEEQNKEEGIVFDKEKCGKDEKDEELLALSHHGTQFSIANLAAENHIGQQDSYNEELEGVNNAVNASEGSPEDESTWEEQNNEEGIVFDKEKYGKDEKDGEFLALPRHGTQFSVANLAAENHIGQQDSDNDITENEEDRQETERGGDDESEGVYDAANASEGSSEDENTWEEPNNEEGIVFDKEKYGEVENDEELLALPHHGTQISIANLAAENHIGQQDSENFTTENDEERLDTESGDDDELRVYDAANASEGSSEDESPWEERNKEEGLVFDKEKDGKDEKDEDLLALPHHGTQSSIANLAAENHIGQQDSHNDITENDEDQQETECGDHEELEGVNNAANASEGSHEDEDPREERNNEEGFVFDKEKDGKDEELLALPHQWTQFSIANLAAENRSGQQESNSDVTENDEDQREIECGDDGELEKGIVFDKGKDGKESPEDEDPREERNNEKGIVFDKEKDGKDAKDEELLALPRNGTKIFIANLSGKVTAQDLRYLCSIMYGEVVDVIVNCDENAERAHAIVTFKRKRAADKAMEDLDGRVCKGMTIRVWEHQAKNCLLLRNIPFYLEEKDVMRRVYKQGPGLWYINLIKIPNYSSRNYAFGYAVYYNQACAEKSMKNMIDSQFMLEGNVIEVKWAPKYEWLKHVHVDNLPENVTEEQMRKLFSLHGEIKSVLVFPQSNFGVVHFADESSAMKVVCGSQKYVIDGHELIATIARERDEREPLPHSSYPFQMPNDVCYSSGPTPYNGFEGFVPYQAPLSTSY